MGAGALQAANSLNIPISTLNRWRAQQEIHHKQSLIKNLVSVDAAIETLCMLSDVEKMDLIEAASIFIVWLRWPTQPQVWQNGITACIFAYYSDKYGDITLDKLQNEDLIQVTKKVRLKNLASMCSNYFDEFPFFELWNIDGQKYNEQDAASELCKFYVEFQGEGRNKNPSIGKAFYHNFDRNHRVTKWNLSFNAFRKFYQEHFVASPFLYIERYFPSIEWTLNPFEAGFAKEIDALIAKGDDRRLFFQRSFKAIRVLQEQMDPRASAPLGFPKCPAIFPPIDWVEAKAELSRK